MFLKTRDLNGRVDCIVTGRSHNDPEIEFLITLRLLRLLHDLSSHNYPKTVFFVTIYINDYFDYFVTSRSHNDPETMFLITRDINGRLDRIMT